METPQYRLLGTDFQANTSIDSRLNTLNINFLGIFEVLTVVC
ncbi:hypothetical protein [Cyanobacterium aponinum]|nr:hypothetical protein [Cyanobacterium aponinum]